MQLSSGRTHDHDHEDHDHAQDHKNDHDPEEVELELGHLDEHVGQQVLFAAKAAGMKASGNFRPRPGDPRPGGRPGSLVRISAESQSKAKCGNCLGEHTSKECKKFLLDGAKINCLICDKPDYSARECPLPDRRKKLAPLVDSAMVVLETINSIKYDKCFFETTQ